MSSASNINSFNVEHNYSSIYFSSDTSDSTFVKKNNISDANLKHNRMQQFMLCKI